jgi:hypothetical protein
MQKASTAVLVIMVISSLGLWGCTNQKNVATNIKIRELENRHAKLEEDYRVILAANETNRRKLILIEAQRAELAQKVEELQGVVRERDELKTQLVSRTEERDGVQQQLMQFSRDLQNLAGRAQAAAARPFGNTITAMPTARKLQ